MNFLSSSHRCTQRVVRGVKRVQHKNPLLQKYHWKTFKWKCNKTPKIEPAFYFAPKSEDPLEFWTNPSPGPLPVFSTVCIYDFFMNTIRSKMECAGMCLTNVGCSGFIWNETNSICQYGSALSLFGDNSSDAIESYIDKQIEPGLKYSNVN